VRLCEGLRIERAKETIEIGYHAVIEHRVASTGKHDAAPIYADNALPVSRRPVLQPSFGGNALCALCQFAPAQRRQQVAGNDDSLPAMLGQA
jgi:hypothetical protein